MIPFKETIDEDGFAWFTDADGNIHETVKELISAHLEAHPTEDTILYFLAVHEVFQERVRAHFLERFAVDEEWRKSWFSETSKPIGIDEMEIDSESVEVTCTTPLCSRGCCGDVTRYFSFPLAHLWQDRTETMAQMAAEKAILDAALAKSNAAAKAAQKARQLQDDRRNLRRLQIKLGVEGP